MGMIAWVKEKPVCVWGGGGGEGVTHYTTINTHRMYN